MATDYGKRLKQARKHAGLSQAALAEKVGIKQPTISDLEKFGHGSVYTAQMAVVCSVNGRWLATGDGEMLATSSHDVLIARKELSALTPEAIDLAVFFDMLTDETDRTIVQNLAMTKILKLLDARGASPIGAPKSIEIAKKQLALPLIQPVR